MTQKDYIKLAKAFKEADTAIQRQIELDDIQGDAPDMAFNIVLAAVVKVLQKDNPKFSQHRFLEVIYGKESAKDADE